MLQNPTQWPELTHTSREPAISFKFSKGGKLHTIPVNGSVGQAQAILSSFSGDLQGGLV